MVSIAPSTLEFLDDLRQNNYRAWFHEHHDRYELARNNVLSVTEELFREINKFDKKMGFPDAKSCLFRIARDTRFSRDKEPYKTHFGVVLSPVGKTCGSRACYYVNIDPYDFYFSCGIYMPGPVVLSSIRRAIHDRWDEFQSILSKKIFREEIGDLCREDKVLKRVPAGFDKNSPASEYLKLTSYYVYTQRSPELLCQESFVPEAGRLFRIMRPFYDFLNQAIGDLK